MIRQQFDGSAHRERGPQSAVFPVCSNTSGAVVPEAIVAKDKILDGTERQLLTVGSSVDVSRFKTAKKTPVQIL